MASETGFESLSYFSRIFKNVTGLSPTHYKMNNHIV
ncbi:helix-turn-helix domain-containing protein [Dyadobacter sp.]